MRAIIRILVIGAVAVCGLQALADSLKLSGTVTDARTGAPIAQVNVSVVGGDAVHDAVTDKKGVFLLNLSSTVRRGDTIRLIVRKNGYDTDDEQVSAGDLSLPISLRPLKPNVPNKPKRPNNGDAQGKMSAPPDVAGTAAEPNKTVPPQQAPTFTEDEDEFNVSAGTISTTFGKGHGGVGCLIMAGNECVANGRVENHKIVVDANLYQGFGLDPLEMEGNKFTLRNPLWDVNSNDTAFEVVDQNLMPRFQIIYTTPHVVFISGVFQANGQIIILSSAGMSIFPANGVISQHDYPAKRMFKYPSRKYQGQEESSDPIPEKHTAYHDLSNSQLCSVVTPEVEKIEGMANQCLRDLIATTAPGGTGQKLRDAVRKKFSDDFRQCCMTRVEELRTELVERVHPVDQRESGDSLIDEMYEEAEHRPTGIILSTVLDIGENMKGLCGALATR
jgi:hypothetical protein